MDRIENIILRNLVFRDEYLRKVLPFIEPTYFTNREERLIFEQIAQYTKDYNTLITKEILSIEIEKRTDITQEELVNINKTINGLEDAESDIEWLTDSTEKWCRDRAIYLALTKSIELADGQDDKQGRDAIPEILSKALAVSFDNHIGHDYLQDYEERYDSYHRKEDLIPFDLEFFNKIINLSIKHRFRQIYYILNIDIK